MRLEGGLQQLERALWLEWRHDALPSRFGIKMLLGVKKVRVYEATEEHPCSQGGGERVLLPTRGCGR